MGDSLQKYMCISPWVVFTDSSDTTTQECEWSHLRYIERTCLISIYLLLETFQDLLPLKLQGNAHIYLALWQKKGPSITETF